MKLLTRDAFREGVFERDNYQCVLCTQPAVDAHHILERRLWPDGGYYLDNGASVCATCHLLCEQTDISVADVRHAAKITRILVPPHLYDDHEYDKWGNPILNNGLRARGELFYDESVQKVLKDSLRYFTPYVKYPRTLHLPWSPGMHDDDRMLTSIPFENQRVIITEKMDGENTTLYSDHIHARSIDSRGGEDRAYVKQMWSKIAHDIPEGWRICGENLWAQHSIHYDNLKSYFYGFSVWNDRNVCLSWNESQEWFELLSITPVRVLYDGTWNEKLTRSLENDLNLEKIEGYVVRLAASFDYSQFRKSVAKYVRKNHIKTTQHWRAGRQFVPNELSVIV